MLNLIFPAGNLLTLLFTVVQHFEDGDGEYSEATEGEFVSKMPKTYSSYNKNKGTSSVNTGARSDTNKISQTRKPLEKIQNMSKIKEVNKQEIEGNEARNMKSAKSFYGNVSR